MMLKQFFDLRNGAEVGTSALIDAMKLANDMKYRGEAGSKEAGRLRLEGKEYVVREGDLMHFRFNV